MEPASQEKIASTKVAVRGIKPLIILFSLLPGHLFTNEALVVPCTLGNRGQIETCSLLDIDATGIVFVHKEMARHFCHVLQISFIPLACEGYASH